MLQFSFTLSFFNITSLTKTHPNTKFIHDKKKISLGNLSDNKLKQLLDQAGFDVIHIHEQLFRGTEISRIIQAKTKQ